MCKQIMKIGAWSLVLLLGCLSTTAQIADSIILNKAFYILPLLENDPILQRELKNSRVIGQAGDRQFERIKNSMDGETNISNYTSAWKWNEAEIAAIGSELIRLYDCKDGTNLLAQKLKRSGHYKLYESSDTGLIRNAWEDAAVGINRIIDVYYEGAAPRYPKIDSISFLRTDPNFRTEVYRTLKSRFKRYDKTSMPFFYLPVYAAMDALALNGRDEAARYEPLSGGLNEKAFRAVKNTNWDNHMYSVILVLGQGPKDPAVRLDPLAIYKCDEAAKHYRNGLAPFIIVSGGHVHPYKTPYCEAVEMKRYLVKQLGVPDSSVFIEPHARHTTTNLRNASRMIYRFGMPFGKPVLVVTDPKHNDYLQGMDERCLLELKYLPYRKLSKIGDMESEFYPVLNSLQADPYDPLDP